MLKYTDTEIVFDEVPNEITLAINISNCPFHCAGCHSPELWENIGNSLDQDSLSKLINKNKGISCISLMGGDRYPELINNLAHFIKHTFPDLKVSWYSGRKNLSEKICLDNFNYIKLGPYIESLGGLDKKTTNQKFYKVYNNELIDITTLFQK